MAKEPVERYEGRINTDGVYSTVLTLLKDHELRTSEVAFIHNVSVAALSEETKKRVERAVRMRNKMPPNLSLAEEQKLRTIARQSKYDITF